MDPRSLRAEDDKAEEASVRCITLHSEHSTTPHILFMDPHYLFLNITRWLATSETIKIAFGESDFYRVVEWAIEDLNL